jgi:hypothetical protein
VTVDGQGVFLTTDGLTLRRSEEVAEALASVLGRRTAGRTDRR